MTAQPYEAHDLPELPISDGMQHAYNDLLTAVNGFPYPGDAANAITYALRWMRANPAQADVLLGRTT